MSKEEILEVLEILGIETEEKRQKILDLAKIKDLETLWKIRSQSEEQSTTDNRTKTI